MNIYTLYLYVYISNIGVDYSYVTYTIEIKRFSTFYITTAVVPMVLITFVSLAGLFNDDLNSRLNLAVTCLLTIIATQYSITQSLPVTDEVSQLGWLALISIIFVSLVTVECSLMISLVGSSDQSSERNGKGQKVI